MWCGRSYSEFQPLFLWSSVSEGSLFWFCLPDPKSISSSDLSLTFFNCPSTYYIIRQVVSTGGSPSPWAWFHISVIVLVINVQTFQTFETHFRLTNGNKENWQSFPIIKTFSPYYEYYYALWSWMNDTNFDLGTQENTLKHYLKMTYLSTLTKAIVFMCLCFFWCLSSSIFI